MSIHRAPVIFIAAILIPGVGCELDAVEEQARGDLVYSGTLGGLYRLERRVEQVPAEHIPPESRAGFAGCGYLTERAEAELNRAMVELDPEAKYAIDVEACRDRWGSHGPFTKIHIDGLIHSPFTCGTPPECCADDLVPLSGFYDRVSAHVTGDGEEYDEILEMHGVDAYPMIEPDERCSSGRS